MLNLFFSLQPHGDRWFPLDRIPRGAIRRLLRGPHRIYGLERTFLNLCLGLDKLGAKYRVNDYRHIRRNPNETACIIGTPYTLNACEWDNPIVFGPAGYSHPEDDPNLLTRLDIRQLLVYGPWMKEMCNPYWGDRVSVWPVGIDTDKWSPDGTEKDIDVLVYDKIMWTVSNRDEMLRQIHDELSAQQLTSYTIRYGHYRESDYLTLLRRSKAMVFLCEHETQGIAYQQALACGVPIMAWDREGDWLDPSYYPRIKFGPVSSVPYWDDRCGVKFKNTPEFKSRLGDLLGCSFNPRDYILEHLTLELCAERYVKLAL